VAARRALAAVRAGFAVAVGLVALSAPARAQTPASAATAAPAAALPVGSAPAPALPGPSVALPGPEPGRVVTPVPAVTSALSVEGLLGAATGGSSPPSALAAPSPSVFDYALGAPGRSGGVSFDGLDPARAALLLDGRPFDDLITGAPRFDLLPLGALGAVRVSDGRLGHPVSVEATARTFRIGRPVTELRYLAGQSGVQVVSGTHAQTRRPPASLRGGSPDARLTLAGHVMSRNGRGTLAGATLRHTDVLARALLTRPGLALDVGVLYTDRTDGARRGVVPGTAESVFSLTATVLEPTATRRTLRTEGWVTSRFRLFVVQPTTVTTSIVTERLLYRSDTADTLRVHARRASVRIAQPLGGLLVRLDAVADDDPHGGADALGDPGARLRFHAAVRDSIALGAALVTAEGGAHVVGSSAFPSAAGRIEGGSLFAAARFGGAVPGRVEEAGLAGVVAATADGKAEHVLVTEAGGMVALGSWRLGLRAFGNSRWNARLLLARDSSTFAYETAPSVLGAAGLTVSVGFRETTARGVYGRIATTGLAPLRPDASALHRREADALPRLRADVRVGSRATGIGGVLDLDLAVVGRAWTAFRGRVVEPVTGLLALPDPGAGLGAVLPARGTLGAEATATFSRRATVFLQIDHALGEVLGAAVVQGEPLPIRVVRFGVFWALLD
jgi:hypothetical protein